MKKVGKLFIKGGKEVKFKKPDKSESSDTAITKREFDAQLFALLKVNPPKKNEDS